MGINWNEVQRRKKLDWRNWRNGFEQFSLNTNLYKIYESASYVNHLQSLGQIIINIISTFNASSSFYVICVIFIILKIAFKANSDQKTACLNYTY